MHKRARGPTIRDVARHADVGVGTVSRVLNDSPLVSDETRRRVRRTIDELGYQPSETARSLSLGRSQTIGVVSPFVVSDSLHARLRGAVQRLAQEGEYDLLLFDATTVRQRIDSFRAFARGDRVDGLLFMSLALTDGEIEQLRSERLAVALVDAVHPMLASVYIDDVRGGELAAEHLIDRGHRRIGFIGDHPLPQGFRSSEDRRLGMRRALQRAGLADDEQLVALGEPDRVQAAAATEALLALADPPTAIFAASDWQAVGVVQAARRLGVRVPEELAVIGFDDLDVAEVLELTTVRQPLQESGRLGVTLLLEALRDPGRAPRHEALPLCVVQRRTT